MIRTCAKRAVTAAAVTVALICSAASSVAAQRAQGMVSLEDARLFYEVVGTGDPIIVVHGGPGLDHNYLQPGLDMLARRYQLVYYDQRGTGRSTAELTDESINLEAFVDDIDVLRESLGHDRVTVLTHSFGSLIGLRYAMRYPERLVALILMNPVEPGTRFQVASGERASERRTPEDVAELAELTGSPGFAARDVETLSQVYRVAFRSTLRDREAVDRLSLDLAPLTASQGQDVARLLGGSMQGLDWWADLAAIQTPTLVLHGRHDIPPLEMGQTLAEAFPTGTFEVLDTGHFPFVEAPEELRRAIAAFFATVR